MAEENGTANLDDILSDAAPVDAGPVEQDKQPVEAEQPTDASGDKEKDEAPPAESSFKDDASPHVPRKALEDERRKRQELQRQLEELTAANRNLQPQHEPQQPRPQRPVPQRPDPWTDPEGAAHYDQMMFQQQLFETRVVTSAELMRTLKPDFEEVQKIFVEAASRDPYLEHQLLVHPMPAKFAYEQGLRLSFEREVGNDPEAYKKRLREEWEAERAAQQSSVPQALAPSAPKSLANASSQPRAKNGQYAAKEDGFASLDDILGG